MPTLRSIGVHPDLRKRLVVATPAEDGGKPQLVPIATPYSLLSRHPGALRLADERLESSKPIAIPQIESLRQDVAVAMLTKSKTGRYWNRIDQTTSCKDGERSALDTNNAMFPSAFDLLQYQQKQLIPKRIELSTGCRSLDRAIALPAEFEAYASSTPFSPTVHGDEEITGIPFGFITQFTGHPASGKSRLAQQLSLACALQGGTVWWMHSSAQPLLSGTPEVLERILVASAWDGFDLLLRLGELERSLQETSDGPKLLIVDSCSVCLGATDDESMYATVSSTIKRLTREYDLATILTIGTVEDRQLGGRKAALGQFWSGVADIEVWLEAEANGTIEATVPRHFAKEVSYAVHCFAITESGIVEWGNKG